MHRSHFFAEQVDAGVVAAHKDSEEAVQSLAKEVGKAPKDLDIIRQDFPASLKFVIETKR